MPIIGIPKLPKYLAKNTGEIFELCQAITDERDKTYGTQKLEDFALGNPVMFLYEVKKRVMRIDSILGSLASDPQNEALHDKLLECVLDGINYLAFFGQMMREAKHQNISEF